MNDAGSEHISLSTNDELHGPNQKSHAIQGTSENKCGQNAGRFVWSWTTFPFLTPNLEPIVYGLSYI